MFSKVLPFLQNLGKALMLPIAVLPIAGLMLRLGQEDLLNIPFMAKSGGVLFDNLPLLFAIGVAVGFSVDAAGAAALAGVVDHFQKLRRRLFHVDHRADGDQQRRGYGSPGRYPLRHHRRTDVQPLP